MSEHTRPRYITRREILRAMGYGTGVLLAGPALAACSGMPGGDAENAGQNAGTDAAVNLGLWTFANTHARWFRSMAEQYKKQNPGFNLKVTEIAYGDMHQKLLVALQSGGAGAPDIADIEQGAFGSFLKGGTVALVDIKDRLTEGEYLDKLVESREALYTYEGKIYGIEHALTPVVIYYRDDIWKKAGVDPTKLTTWDDFIQGARSFAESKVTALPFPVHDVILRQRGGDYFNESGQVTIDSDLSIETMEWILALRDQHEIANEAPDAEPAWWGAVKEGKYASVVGADWYGGILKDSAPSLSGKWKAMPLPAWGQDGIRTSCWGGTGACIVQTSKNVEQAWKFLEFSMLTVDGQVARYLETKLYPPFKPAMDDPRLNTPDEYFSGQDLGDMFGRLAPDVPPQYQSPYRAQLNTELDPLMPNVLAGKREPAEVFKQVAEKIRQVMEQEQG